MKLRIDAFALSAATLGELVMQFQQECVRAVDAIGEDDKPETRKHCELMDVVRRPFKPASFEPFCEQAGSLAIVPNDLDQITTVRFIMHPSIKFRATGRLYRIDNLHKTWGVDRRHPAPLSGRLPRLTHLPEPSTASQEGFALQEEFLCTRLLADPTQIPSFSAAFIKLIIGISTLVASYSGIPRRSRMSRTRTAVQLSPLPVLQSIRLRETASSRSGQCPPSLRSASTADGASSAGYLPVLTRATRTSVCRPPVQWINSTASLVASSRSQIIS
ncbi:UNVERIFIED_ORG: hypothetical protein GGI57_006413 [Rhizobium aethiopicum]